MLWLWLPSMQSLARLEERLGGSQVARRLYKQAVKSEPTHVHSYQVSTLRMRCRDSLIRLQHSVMCQNCISRQEVLSL